MRRASRSTRGIGRRCTQGETLVREDCVVVRLYHERIHAAAAPAVQGLRFHRRRRR